MFGHVLKMFGLLDGNERGGIDRYEVEPLCDILKSRWTRTTSDRLLRIIDSGGAGARDGRITYPEFRDFIVESIGNIFYIISVCHAPLACPTRMHHPMAATFILGQ